MTSRSPRTNAIRELLAVAAVGLIVLIYLGVIWETRPSSFMTGRIVGFGLVEQKGYGQIGSAVRAQVGLRNNQMISISLPNASRCRVGSQIEIEEVHTFFGSRFKAGLRDCSITASLDAT